MATGLKLPIVQHRLEHDYPNSSLVQMLQTLDHEKDVTNEEFAVAQKHYLVFLTCQMLYNKYLVAQNGVRRRNHIQNLIGKQATVEGFGGLAAADGTSVPKTRPAGNDAKLASSQGAPAAIGAAPACDLMEDKTVPKRKK
ncbi:small capsid protein [Common bottlenose dolphin gammaherpesvirus 1 strain Sarasota]|uniref:Small capsid protein n=1 Tax=Common bottlenose dolphin gammaherpesvirus 1 strain Sarasota TaxID=2022783 RepID=A0A1Z1NE41_9GAMA|nr:small capsid protein [Common bottlenose dolphin gammaherpesvirus 1 strain Sarasota]ARW78127.1 small capsid protein [Common bottlenose dolphin gammaherpesvirus 1 strain Sarasota]